MERIPRDLRPSSTLSSCPPAATLLTPGAQAHVLGQSAVAIHVRTAPIFGLEATTGTANKINNYRGITSAMGEGSAASTVMRTQQIQIDKVNDARGIPPRGRPV